MLKRNRSRNGQTITRSRVPWLTLINILRFRQWGDTPAVPSSRYSDMTDMEKDKLLDYLFDQNAVLTAQLSGVREELRLQREQAYRHHKELKADLGRIEERAEVAEKKMELAEKRAAKAEEERSKAEKKIEDLIKTIDSLMDTSVMEELRNQIIELRRQRDDALAFERHNRAERYGRTSQKMRGAGVSDNDEDDI